MVNTICNGGIEFKIFCSNKDLDGSLLKGVEFNEWVTYNTNTKVLYSSGSNILPVLQQEIKKQKPKHLLIIGIYDWQFNFKPLLYCRGIKKIISVRGMMHPGALSQNGFKKKIYLQLWKIFGLDKQCIFHATNIEERKYIQQIFRADTKVLVASNFPRVFPLQAIVKKELAHLKLLSIALISPMKNISMVLEALLVVSGELPVVSCSSSVVNVIEYNIYGPVKDKTYWEQCEFLIKKLPPNITVNYHGDIKPEKSLDVLAASHVFILPSKSENFGHAIYEALSAGRSVITSNTTPWNNLEVAKAGINVSLNEKDELVKAIVFFAGMDQEEMEEWSMAAGKYAEGAIDVNIIKKQYEEMFW
jgi:glycosyltransferase involved in cell wall biosynthesis